MKKALVVLAVIILASPVYAETKTTAAQGALQMTLTYDINSGEATLTNTTGEPVDVDGYQIVSAGGNLSPTGWVSIDDMVEIDAVALMNALGSGALSFGEVDPTAAVLTEINLSGQATFQSDAAWSIGQPIVAGTGVSDLTLYYTKPGVAGDQFLGQIVMVPEPATMSLLALGGIFTLRRRK